MKKGKNWALVDAVLGVIGGLCGVVGIFTAMKASSYNEEQQYKALEDRYGLTPVETEGDED